MIGSSIPFADAAGTLTLQNVDALDATTLATVIAAISSNGSEYDDDVAVCWGDDDDFCIEHDTDGSPDGLRLTQADCDGSPCDPLKFYKDGGNPYVSFAGTAALLIPSGTVSIPAIVFAADNDGTGTGIYRSGADNVGIVANNSLRFNVAYSIVKSYTRTIIDGQIVISADKDTINDTGNGDPGAHTLTPTKSYVELTCNDGDGCNITIGESGVYEGEMVSITNVGTNVCNFSDSPGVSELSGAFAMGQYDVLMLVYDGTTWIEASRSDN
jgi:hypothetical protein